KLHERADVGLFRRIDGLRLCGALLSAAGRLRCLRILRGALDGDEEGSYVDDDQGQQRFHGVTSFFFPIFCGDLRSGHDNEFRERTAPGDEERGTGLSGCSPYDWTVLWFADEQPAKRADQNRWGRLGNRETVC